MTFEKCLKVKFAVSYDFILLLHTSQIPWIAYYILLTAPHKYNSICEKWKWVLMVINDSFRTIDTLFVCLQYPFTRNCSIPTREGKEEEEVNGDDDVWKTMHFSSHWNAIFGS